MKSKNLLEHQLVDAYNFSKENYENVIYEEWLLEAIDFVRSMQYCSYNEGFIKFQNWLLSELRACDNLKRDDLLNSYHLFLIGMQED